MMEARRFIGPMLLAPLLALLALPAIGSPSTWLTLTIASLAMGMMIFTIASGLTLIFGLMDVLNFGHGLFITLGAYIGASVLIGMGESSLLGLFVGMLLAMLGAALAGLVFERLLVKPVYGDHLTQILVTTGGMIIGEEIIKVIWGVQQISVSPPALLRGSLVFGDVTIERFRLFALAVGLLVFVVQLYVFHRTKIGLLIRAGVHDREMIECLGYRIRVLFIGTFLVGTALAGLGGMLWGLYQQILVPQLGAQANILIFIVIIIGGLGSTSGALLGAILVGLTTNYTGFLAPKVALFSTISLMVAILLWRPRGIYPVGGK